jgi:hypothetical protein
MLRLILLQFFLVQMKTIMNSYTEWKEEEIEKIT